MGEPAYCALGSDEIVIIHNNPSGDVTELSVTDERFWQHQETYSQLLRKVASQE